MPCGVGHHNFIINEKMEYLRVMFDGQGVQWDISNIFRPYCPYLVCGKLSSKTYPPYEKVNFQNHFFTNLKVDSDSSQKSVYTNYSSFLNIPTRSWSNTQKRPFFEGKLDLPSISKVFYLFDQLLIRIF